MAKIRKIHCPDCGSEDLSWVTTLNFNARMQVWRAEWYDPTKVASPAWCMACTSHVNPLVIELDVAGEISAVEWRERGELALEAAYNHYTPFLWGSDRPKRAMIEDMIIALLKLATRPNRAVIPNDMGMDAGFIIAEVSRVFYNMQATPHANLTAHDVEVTPGPLGGMEVRYDRVSDRYFGVEYLKDGKRPAINGPFQTMQDALDYMDPF